jgi:predicted dehydrogenase
MNEHRNKKRIVIIGIDNAAKHNHVRLLIARKKWCHCSELGVSDTHIVPIQVETDTNRCRKKKH